MYVPPLLAVALCAAPLAAQAELDETLTAELLARVRWPLAVESDVVAFFDPSDVAVDPARIRLGGRLYQVGVDSVFHARAGASVTVPFAGAKHDEDDPDLLGVSLGGGKVALRIHVSGWRRADSGWQLAPHEPILEPPCPELPRWSQALAKEVTALGYTSGPRLELRFDGLEQLFSGQPSKAQIAALLWNVIVPRFRRESARKVVDPGPGLRGRERLLDRTRKREDGWRPVGHRPFHSSQLRGLPPLGFFVRQDGHETVSELQRSGFDELKHAGEARIHERLLSRFLAGLRWPLPDPGPGFVRMHRPDDSWQRHGLEEHRAIDLGATLWRAGKLFVWPVGTPVARPHAEATPTKVARTDCRPWLVELTEGRYTLRVMMLLYHLDRDGRLSGLGTGASGWRSADPWFRVLGIRKGNHTHLEVLGLFPGAPARERLFVRDRLAPALLAAPGAPAGPRPVAMIARDRAQVRLSQLLFLAASHLPALPVAGGSRLTIALRLTAENGWQRLGRGRFERRIPLDPRLGVSLQLAGREQAGGLARGPITIRVERLGEWPCPESLWAPLEHGFLVPRVGQNLRN